MKARRQPERAVYWDASTLITWLGSGPGSQGAHRLMARADLAHLMSSLTLSETHSVLARLESARRPGEWRAQAGAPPPRGNRVS